MENSITSKFFFRGIKQHEKKDCAAACLATISKYYGVSIPLAVARDLVKVDKNGASIYGIIQGAKELDIDAEGLEGSLNEFKNEVLNEDITLPVIAHTLCDNNAHFIVILKVDSQKMKIFDPNSGLKSMSIKDMELIWTGRIVTLYPQEKFFFLKERWKPFKKYLTFFLAQKKLIFSVVAVSLVVALISIITAFSYQTIIDNHILRTAENSQISSMNKIIDYISNNFTVLFVSLVVLYLMQGGLMYFRTSMMGKLSKNLIKEFMLFFYNHLIHLKGTYFRTHETGETIARYQSLSVAQNLFFQIFLTIILESVMIFIGGWSLYTLNSKLFGITLLILLVYALITFSYIRPLNKINRSIMNNEAESLTHINETLEGMETIKMFCSEEFFTKKFTSKTQKLTNDIGKSIFIQNSLSTLIFLVESIGVLGILVYGSKLVIDGEITLGTLISFESLSIVFISPIKNLINIQESVQNAYITFDRLNDILEIELEENSWLGLDGHSNFVPEITFEQVCFAYNYQSEQLKNVDLNIEKYSKVGVVGTNGSGKTTLLKLMSSLIIPDYGEIKIGGKNMQKYQLSYLRKNIAYVPQESYFFNGTVEDNLRMGVSSINEKQFKKIFLGLKIDEIEDNLKTQNKPIIVENGLNLSSGQKQKLGIARALIRNPKILLLDEATSNLDSIAEKEVLEFIKEHFCKTTVISIFHNMNLATNFDEILMIDDEKRIICDSHSNLMFTNKKYKKLFSDTFNRGRLK